jgi:hypothetical protein
MMANTTAPPGVSGNSPAYWVQATVTDKVFNFFGSFGGVSAFNINAQATAGVTTLAAGACIYVLDPSAAKAFNISGSSSVTATCGIFVNSSSSDAFDASGGSSTSSTQILINGGSSIKASVTPTPTTGAGPQSDPLASLAMPTFTSNCDHTNYTLSTTGTLSAGTYCGGITIQGGGIATFSSGLYIINGGGVTFQGGSKENGTGVTFFNTGQYGQSPAPVTFSGSSVVTLTAPDSGTYQGMLFVQDRNLSYTTANSISGASGSLLTGTLYFPSTSVTYTGSSTTGAMMRKLGISRKDV